MDESFLSISGRLLAVLVLVAANGFFVAAEFALVTVRRTRIEQLAIEGHRTARLLRGATSRVDTYIAACQLGITMASLALGWIGEPALGALLEPITTSLPEWMGPLASHGAAVALSFAIITGLHVVIGELSPKGVALQYSERTAFAVIWPLHAFLVVFRPVIWLFNQAGWVVLKPFGIKPGGEHVIHSPEELKLLVQESGEAGLFLADEEQIIGRVLEFSQLAAHQVMIPRTEVIAIPADASLEDLINTISHYGHTRYPVYAESLDNVVGVIHAKDVILAMHANGGHAFNLRRVMREPVTVPETVSLSDVLREMRSRGTQMAVAIDEFGGTAGLVMMEDILERIVGELRDEFDRPQELLRRLPDGSAVIDGLMLVRDFNERFELELDEDPYDTLGGYVFGALGRRPQPGDEIRVDGHTLRVEALDGLRVSRVRLIESPEAEPFGEKQATT
ncbi:MAG TPA: hemolysin family protein [Dehalococcoidia bacterium]|nr:hemolysin family protein [Dehalococcoidia bacterium]